MSSRRRLCGLFLPRPEAPRLWPGRAIAQPAEHVGGAHAADDYGCRASSRHVCRDGCRGPGAGRAVRAVRCGLSCSSGKPSMARLGIGRPISFSMAATFFSSRWPTSMNACPMRPARPVRPMRCT